MKEMNCNIIEDLIPLYNEGLCSEDTAEMVREHIEGCDSCRKLCEDISGENTGKVDVPDESRVFRMVSKKMKRSRLKIILLSLVLLTVLGGLGFLTFGQITHKDGLISFETLVQSIETRKIAKYIAKGDMDAYADSITFGTNFDANFNILKNMDEIRDQNRLALNEAYDKYMSGKKAKYVLSFAQYLEGDLVGNSSDRSKSSTIQNTARIKYDDGSEMILELVKSYDGKYICQYAYPGIDGSKEANGSIEKMAKIINYVNIPKFYPDGLADMLFMKYNKAFFDEHPDYDHFLMGNWFTSDYQEQVNSGMLSYYKDKGFTFDKFIASEIRYDKEKKMFYYDFMFEGKDEKGTAIMTAKLYSTPEGLIPPAQEDMEIISNGCTDELVTALKEFFGKT